MTLEEKLKAKSIPLMQKYMWIDQPAEMQKEQVILLKDALSICQEAVDEANKAHREELLLLTDKYNAMRIKEIDEACKKQNELLQQLLEAIPHNIPFYAYGDNEAACEMDAKLQWIYTELNAIISPGLKEKL